MTVDLSTLLDFNAAGLGQSAAQAMTELFFGLLEAVVSLIV